MVFISGCNNSNSTPKTITLNPTEDAFVDRSDDGKNFGGENYLKVYDSTGGIFVDESFTYLKFDLSNIPKDANIISTKLKLYTNYVSESYRIGVYEGSDDSWNEFEIRWNNKPAFNQESKNIIKVTLEDSWHEWDVKDIINSKKGQVATIILKSIDVHKDSMYVKFLSIDQTEEYNLDKKPQLVVEYYNK